MSHAFKTLTRLAVLGLSIGTATTAFAHHEYARYYGEGAQGMGFWVDTFGTKMRSVDTENNRADDKRSNTYGFTLGFDESINARNVMGIAFSYSDTDIEFDGAPSSGKIVSDMYQATVYNHYTCGDLHYDWSGGLGFNRLRRLHNDFDKTTSRLVFGSVKVSKPQTWNGFHVTPNAGLFGATYTQEEGEGRDNSTFSTQRHNDVFRAHVGVDVATPYYCKHRVFHPYASVKLSFDFKETEAVVMDRFTEAYTVANLDYRTGEIALKYGAGLIVTSTDRLTLSLGGEVEHRDELDISSGKLSLHYVY